MLLQVRAKSSGLFRIDLPICLPFSGFFCFTWPMTSLETPDATDRQLLALIQSDATLTLEQLAHAVSASSSAVQRRLQRLRDAGFIVGQVALLDPAKLGPILTFLVELELERDRHQMLPQLNAWIAAEEAVQQAFYVTGRGDYLLVILQRSVDGFDALMERMTTQNPNIRKFTTSLALKTTKRGLAVPVT
jgi:Lrp/AsnC family transcriptional regulator, leucine-responsive regulatory protein